MNSIPTRININQIRNSPKKQGRPNSSTFLGLPVESNKSQVPPYTIVAQHLTLPEAKFVQSRNKSVASKSRVVSSGTESVKNDKLRQLMMEHIEEISKNLKSKIKYAEHIDVTKMIKSLSQIVELEEFLDFYLKCYDLCGRLAIPPPPEDDENDMRFQLNIKQKKRLILIDQSTKRDEKHGKRRNVRDLERDNENLKKDLFKCREFIKSLEKRILSLVEEYQDRKKTYMTEIEKLTKILNTSLINIPDLLLKGKEMELIERKSPPHRKHTDTTNQNTISSNRKEYNTLSMPTDFLNALSLSHEAIYKIINNPEIVKSGTDPTPTPMNRYRSQETLKRI